MTLNTVFFINGFLEAGKTTFIKDLLKRDFFKIEEQTLIIACEEGEEEYDKAFLEEGNAVVHYLEKEEDFCEEVLTEIEKKYHTGRTLIEFNGMWDKKNKTFPWYWDDIMEIAILDAKTFKLYSDNMRSLLADKIRDAEIVMMYNSDVMRDQVAAYTRNLKLLNKSANFVFKGKNGNIKLEEKELLPYDINAAEITLSDSDFAVFCLDSQDKPYEYRGKTVNFIAKVYVMKEDSEIQFVAGRHIMTCCAEDMQFTGIICSYVKSYELANGEWVSVSGIIRVEYDKEMKKEIPICRVLELEQIDAPEEEIIKQVI